MPRFVILEHDHPVLHWDLMLEAGAVLQTWRLARAPAPGEGPIEATALGDHRAMYLDYEGPVGGGRGTVRRFDAGTFVEANGSTSQQRQLEFHGTRLQGRWRLQRLSEVNWRLAPTEPEA